MEVFVSVHVTLENDSFGRRGTFAEVLHVEVQHLENSLFCDKSQNFDDLKKYSSKNLMNCSFLPETASAANDT